MNLRRLLAVTAAAVVGVFVLAGQASAALPSVTHCIATEGTTTISVQPVSGGRLVTGTFTVTCPTTVTLAAYSKTAGGLTFPQVLIASTSRFLTSGTHTLTLTVPHVRPRTVRRVRRSDSGATAGSADPEHA